MCKSYFRNAPIEPILGKTEKKSMKDIKQDHRV